MSCSPLPPPPRRFPAPPHGLAAGALVVALLLPDPTLAHSKGLYKTQAEAEQRAKQLGCQGTHQNNGLWMPCSGEAMLHKELRQD